MKTNHCSVEPLESRIAPATFIVNTVNDSIDAHGSATVSLRDALGASDALGGKNKIVFDLPASSLVNGAFTIVLTNGVLTSNGDVTITGPGAGKLIVNGDGSSGVFDFNNHNSSVDSPVSISGLSIVAGAVSGDGGGIYSAESLTLRNVVISGCASTGGDGGAVDVHGSSTSLAKVSISNSFFSGNSAENIGGGLDLVDLKAISISNTVVTGNVAKHERAGGIYASLNGAGTGIAITGCAISGNNGSYGGGLFVKSAAVLPTAKTIISASIITGDNATNGGTAGGGGLYVAGGNTVITRSTIRENTAIYNGGGIDANGFDSLTIASSIITGNQTVKTNANYQGGGGAFIHGAGSATPLPVKITGTLITDNRTADSGGGLYALNGLALGISGSTVSGNNAPHFGGGLSTDGGGSDQVNLTVTGGTISDNGASDGGGIWAGGAGAISITGSKVTGNFASNGGGGIFANSANIANGVTIKDMVATANTTRAGGGGLLLSDTANFHVSGGSFTDNSAVYAGGISVYNSTGSIEGVTISYNTATEIAGGVFNRGSFVTLQIAKVIANSAPSYPNTYGTFTPFP